MLEVQNSAGEDVYVGYRLSLVKNPLTCHKRREDLVDVFTRLAANDRHAADSAFHAYATTSAPCVAQQGMIRICVPVHSGAPCKVETKMTPAHHRVHFAAQVLARPAKRTADAHLGALHMWHPLLRNWGFVELCGVCTLWHRVQWPRTQAQKAKKNTLSRHARMHALSLPFHAAA